MGNQSFDIRGGFLKNDVLHMKIGRNSPCPCGSGKKYKHCCIEKRSIGQIVLDDIAEASEEQEFSSLEELNAFANQRMEVQNKRSLTEFCGLSPEQMYHLLYTPFTAPETVQFATDVESTGNSGIMRIFTPLVEAIGENGLKATAKGNLPLKFCKAMAEQLRQQDNGVRRLRIGGISSGWQSSVLLRASYSGNNARFAKLHCLTGS